ncbi:MAG: thioredoxin domain-containing protein [Opitutaceae bacterium]|nr:thioredoxin domain-containing protein [Opitutaceae bacterium]
MTESDGRPRPRPNRLAHEKSPYLRQHMHNLVDWLPWGEEAFARARREQKPIFLSVGYSTCHWCHVMAHESFENETVAATLNRHFVPVKVDREERPDIDHIYMTYVQAATGRGGWPMSVWLTPGLKPFYGGTYFPPEDRQGRAGFLTVLRALAKGWTADRENFIKVGEQVTEALRGHGRNPAQFDSAAATGEDDLAILGEEAVRQCYAHCSESFDPNWGGFGSAPKFPRPAVLNFLFRFAGQQRGEAKDGAEAVRMAYFTLQKMAEGGMHDHVGGGFHRYSVDAEWFVPHFEKMLYDQAQLASVFLEARQATGDEFYARIAREVFDYVGRDLTSPSGGFYSAEDADSLLRPGAEEHAEGAYYVWSQGEIERALGADAEIFCLHFGVQAGGNVEGISDPLGEFRGKNVLRQRRALAATADECRLDVHAAGEKLRLCLARLREARASRPRPHLDDKIITAWSGLMISALAKGVQVLGDPACLAAGIRAAEFLRRELYDPARGVLYRNYREGRSAIEGFAEDYAFLVQGLLDLYEASFEIRWLQWAEQLQAAMDGLFWDGESGGYFNSRAGDPGVIVRLKEDYDGAEPAPSSVAAFNLLRLARALGENDGSELRRTDRARRTIESLRARWIAAPSALPQMLCATMLALEPPRTVVIAGDPRRDDFRELTAVLHERLGPRRVLLAADGGAGQQWLAERMPYLAEMKPLDGRATAYVCENFTCRQPVSTPTALRSLLK